MSEKEKIQRLVKVYKKKDPIRAAKLLEKLNENEEAAMLYLYLFSSPQTKLIDGVPR